MVVSTRANLVTAVKPKIRLTDLSRVCPSSHGGDARWFISWYTCFGREGGSKNWAAWADLLLLSYVSIYEAISPRSEILRAGLGTPSQVLHRVPDLAGGAFLWRSNHGPVFAVISAWESTEYQLRSDSVSVRIFWVAKEFFKFSENWSRSENSSIQKSEGKSVTFYQEYKLL